MIDDKFRQVRSCATTLELTYGVFHTGALYAIMDRIKECIHHDHMLHRTGLLTEAKVRGRKATEAALLPRTCASVNNPVR